MILGYLSDYTVESRTWIWWGRRLSRDIYTPDGQRRLARLRPLIFFFFAMEALGGLIFFLSL